MTMLHDRAGRRKRGASEQRLKQKVRESMRPGTETERADQAVEVELVVEAPRERAFQTFTERMDEWWPRDYRLGSADRVGLVLEPRIGGRWYERTADEGECDWGRTLAWDAPGYLVLSWQIGVGFVPESDPERASRVEVRFTSDGPARTRIQLVHSAFERHGEGWESMRDGVSREGGWPGLLEGYSNLAAG
jgi:uncharacterized protein YndB with AHSA1/START domain